MLNIRCTRGFINQSEFYEGDADFTTGKIPGYRFKRDGGKGPSWVDMYPCGECDPGQEPPPDPGPPDPAEILGAEGAQGPDVPMGDDCCVTDLCWKEVLPDSQCCGTMIRIGTGRCRTCTHWAIYRSNCQVKGEGDYAPPDPWDEFPYGDHRVPEFCDGSLGGGGWDLISLHGFVPAEIPTAYFTMTREADYLFVTGTFKDDPQTGDPVWCTSWAQGIHAGDLDNPDNDLDDGNNGIPKVFSEYITADQMFADQLDGGPQFFKTDFAEEDPTIKGWLLNAQTNGCVKVQKVTVADHCFLGWTEPPPPNGYWVFEGVYEILKPIFDDPAYYKYEPDDPITKATYWHLIHPSSNLVFVWDKTNWPDCNAPDPPDTKQHFVYYFMVPTEVEIQQRFIHPEAQYTLDNGGDNSLYSCETYWAWMVRDHTWTSPFLGPHNFEWIFHEYPHNGLAEWETPPGELYRRIDYGNIDMLSERDFEKVYIPGTNDYYIKPTNEMTTCSWQEALDGVPFALYYKWTCDASEEHANLAINPRIDPSDPEWDYAGKPELYLEIEDQSGIHEEFWPPFKSGDALDPANCELISSGAWCWPCVKADTVLDSKIWGSTKCMAEMDEFYQAQALQGEMPEKPKYEITIQFKNALDGSHYLINPAVSGDHQQTLQAFGYENGYEDGPVSFAICEFSSCVPVDSLRVRIKPYPYWQPIEEFYQDVGNSYENTETDGSGGLWLSYFLESPVATDGHYYPPIRWIQHPSATCGLMPYST